VTCRCVTESLNEESLVLLKELLLSSSLDRCDTHVDKQLEVYCKICRTAICLMCSVDTAHHSHERTQARYFKTSSFTLVILTIKIKKTHFYNMKSLLQFIIPLTPVPQTCPWRFGAIGKTYVVWMPDTNHDSVNFIMLSSWQAVARVHCITS